MYQRILVPLDDGAISDRALDEAIRLARLTGGQLCLFHVLDDLSMAVSADTAVIGYVGELIGRQRARARRMLNRGLARATAAGVAAQTVLREDFSSPVDARVIGQAEVWKADLIVIGTHGRRGLARLMLGSSAERILRLSPVPVLLVRGLASSAQAAEATAASTATHD